METFKILIVILLSSVLVDNYVLSRFLGICPFLGVSKKLDQAVGMGVAVTLVMLIATAHGNDILKTLNRLEVDKNLFDNIILLGNKNGVGTIEEVI